MRLKKNVSVQKRLTRRENVSPTVNAVVKDAVHVTGVSAHALSFAQQTHLPGTSGQTLPGGAVF